MIVHSLYYGSYSNSKVATINPYIEGYVEWSEKYHPRRFFAASTVVKNKFGYLEVWLPMAGKDNHGLVIATSRKRLNIWKEKSKNFLVL
jgi:hypothetical protein